MTEYEEHTAITRAGDAFAAELTDGWLVGGGVNGGYMRR